MTLSALLSVLLALFLIPCFLLPKNRLQFYLLCSLPAFLVPLLLFFLDLSFPSYLINERIGEAFLGMWHWLYRGYEELNTKEVIHLSTSFTYLFFYFVSFLLCYIPARFLYIGSNPDIHRPIKTITRIITIVFFLITTYGFLAVFLINIREILPFQDGSLSFFFDWFYQIEV